MVQPPHASCEAFQVRGNSLLRMLRWPQVTEEVVPRLGGRHANGCTWAAGWLHLRFNTWFSASDLSTSYTSDVLSLLELVKFLRMMAICTVISATSPVSSRVFTQSFHPEFSPCFPSFPHILPAFPMYFPPARTICSSPAQCSSIASSRAADTVARSATSSQASETFACHSAKASSQAMATVGFTNGGEIHKNFLGIWMEYERNMNVIWYKWINIWDIHGTNMNGIWIKSRIWYLGVTLK